MLLQNSASSLLPGLLPSGEDDALDCLVEDVLQPVLGECRTFQIHYRADLFRQSCALLRRDRLLPLLSHLVDGRFVVAHVRLCSHENDLRRRRVMLQLGDPFGLDVLERSQADDRCTMG